MRTDDQDNCALVEWEDMNPGQLIRDETKKQGAERKEGQWRACSSNITKSLPAAHSVVGTLLAEIEIPVLSELTLVHRLKD